MDIKSIYRQVLSEWQNEGRWGGRCFFCGEPWNELAHNFSDSKPHRKLMGETLLDMPLTQLVPSCRECNSGIHRGYSREIKCSGADALALILIARETWERYARYAMNTPAVISGIKKL